MFSISDTVGNLETADADWTDTGAIVEEIVGAVEEMIGAVEEMIGAVEEMIGVFIRKLGTIVGVDDILVAVNGVSGSDVINGRLIVDPNEVVWPDDLLPLLFWSLWPLSCSLSDSSSESSLSWSWLLWSSISLWT